MFVPVKSPEQAPSDDSAHGQGGKERDVAYERDLVCERVAKRYKLTPRETEVLCILADGYSLPYIQEKLCIERGTATTHCHHIYQKLGIHKRDELYDFLSGEAEKLEDRSLHC